MRYFVWATLLMVLCAIIGDMMIVRWGLLTPSHTEMTTNAFR